MRKMSVELDAWQGWQTGQVGEERSFTHTLVFHQHGNYGEGIRRHGWILESSLKRRFRVEFRIAKECDRTGNQEA